MFWHVLAMHGHACKIVLPRGLLCQESDDEQIRLRRKLFEGLPASQPQDHLSQGPGDTEGLLHLLWVEAPDKLLSSSKFI